MVKYEKRYNYLEILVNLWKEKIYFCQIKGNKEEKL